MADSSRNSILTDAIMRENSANAFYLQLAGRVSNSAVRETFLRLAADELGHKELLEKMLADAAAAQGISAPSVDYHIAESEDKPEVISAMPLKDAVAIAMKKEQEAVELYRAFANGSPSNDIKAIFENLMNMELGHKQALERVFVDIGYPEVF